MSTAIGMILLTLLSADAEPEGAPGDPPEPRPTPELMNAAWGVSPQIFGRGRILEAKLEDFDGDVHLSVRTARGWQSVPLRIGTGEGTFYSVEDLRFAGNGLVVEIERYHDPCGCDDGPVWVDVFRSNCRLVQGGALRCSAPRHIYHYDTAPAMD